MRSKEAHEAGAAPAAMHNKDTLGGHGGALGTSSASAAAGQWYAPATMSVKSLVAEVHQHIVERAPTIRDQAYQLVVKDRKIREQDRTIAEQRQKIAELERELDTERKKAKKTALIQMADDDALLSTVDDLAASREAVEERGVQDGELRN
jgi:hypothetical protein